jgi:trimeric autotransporter adhesin
MSCSHRRMPPIALLLIGALLAWAGTATAQTAKKETGLLDGLAFAADPLKPADEVAPMADLQSALAPGVADAWATLTLDAGGEWSATVDRRTGRLEFAEGAGIPWVPGAGNHLTADDVVRRLGAPAAGALASTGKPDLATLEALARDLLQKAAPALGVDPASLVLNRDRSRQIDGYVWFVDFDVLRDGRPIDGARVVFRVNNGNLIQFGGENLPPPDAAAPAVEVTREAAQAVVTGYIGGAFFDDVWLDEGSLHLLPVAAADGYEIGRGRSLATVWQFEFRRPGELGTWRARVDATSGQLLEFVDVNDYGRVRGGVYLNAPPTETEMPMPFADDVTACTTPYANSGGVFPDGTGVGSSLCGQYVGINDQCGTIRELVNAAGDIDFGTSGGTDCTTPGHGGAGNTHAARTQFYHLNRAKEMARGWLTSTWLSQRLTANLNLNQTCNAYWNGSTVNFFRSGGGCGNTGEIPGVSLHEYGHGLDQNDGSGTSVDHGTGETYGDFTAALTLHDSCIGPTFLGSNCGGYGNACTACTGVRDIDYAKHSSGTPATVDGFTRVYCPSGFGYNGPCGREGHCESYVSSEGLWDFGARDLPYAGTGAAWNVVERLWYLSRPTATAAFVCHPTGSPWTSDGCATGSYWRTMRAVDDDDGNLNNGTPHSCNLYAAFNRHGMACTTDPGANTCYRGCAQPPAPALTVTAGYNQTSLAWSSSGSVVVYDVYRSERGCDAGFTKIANDVTASSYTDSTVAAGVTYSYQVVAHPSGNEACGSIPSSCQSVPVPQYYACTVDVAAGTNTCTSGFITVTSSSGVQRVLSIDLSAGWQRLDAFADLCSPSGWVFHLSDSPSCNGFGGDSGQSTHDAEVHLTDTTFYSWGTSDPVLGIEPVYIERGVVPASGCSTSQWTVLEDQVGFDDDGDPATAGKISVTSTNEFEVPPYDEPDSEDTGHLYENFWYAGINRTVGTSSRSGTGAQRVCFVLSTTTNPSPAALSSLCGN